jgi:hypothetical protein
VLGDRDVHDGSAVLREHDQDEQQPIRDRWNHEEVNGHTCPMWFARNVHPVCDGDGRRRPRYFATVDWLTVMPSFCNSPWIRGAPQRGLASDMVRINAWTSAGTAGRPVRRRLFQVQNRRKPRRCQATTVSGFTRTSAARQSGQIRENQTQSSRSAAVKRTRGRAERSKT